MDGGVRGRGGLCRSDIASLLGQGLGTFQGLARLVFRRVQTLLSLSGLIQGPCRLALFLGAGLGQGLGGARLGLGGLSLGAGGLRLGGCSLGLGLGLQF